MPIGSSGQCFGCLIFSCCDQMACDLCGSPWASSQRRIPRLHSACSASRRAVHDLHVSSSQFDEIAKRARRERQHCGGHLTPHSLSGPTRLDRFTTPDSSKPCRADRALLIKHSNAGDSSHITSHTAGFPVALSPSGRKRPSPPRARYPTGAQKKQRHGEAPPL